MDKMHQAIRPEIDIICFAQATLLSKKVSRKAAQRVLG
jgi:hypothetical protein